MLGIQAGGCGSDLISVKGQTRAAAKDPMKALGNCVRVVVIRRRRMAGHRGEVFDPVRCHVRRDERPETRSKLGLVEKPDGCIDRIGLPRSAE